MIRIQTTKNRRKKTREYKEQKIFQNWGTLKKNKRDELEREEIILSKQTQKEGDGDDLVDTDTDTNTDTDMSETNKRDQAKHHDLHRTLHSLRIGHDD